MITCGRVDIGERERRLVAEVLDSGRLTRGPMSERLDAAISSWLGRSAYAVSSGTAALHLALLGCGVGPKDEVIVPATTFVATYNAVRYVGATPVVVDVDSKTWMPTHGQVERAITRRTKAIMAVHLYGVPSFTFNSLVHAHYRSTGRRIYVIEDCAEAIGARISGDLVGRWGDVAAFSFYGSKTVTTGGEGGAVAWTDPVIGDRMKHLAGQAQTRNRYEHDTVGYNYRLTELQAAVGLAQFERLDEFLAARRQVCEWYDGLLHPRFGRQQVAKDDTSGHWAFAVYRPPMQARVIERRLAESGIETRPIFPAVERDYDRIRVAHSLHHHGLVLPTHAGLSMGDVARVCEELHRADS